MRKWFCLVGLLLLLAGASIPGAHAGEVLFQYSTFDALLGDLYDGGHGPPYKTNLGQEKEKAT